MATLRELSLQEVLTIQEQHYNEVMEIAAKNHVSPVRAVYLYLEAHPDQDPRTKPALMKVGKWASWFSTVLDMIVAWVREWLDSHVVTRSGKPLSAQAQYGLDWLFEFITSFLNGIDMVRTVEQAELDGINALLTEVVPALEAYGGYVAWATDKVLVPILTHQKEWLEAELAKQKALGS